MNRKERKLRKIIREEIRILFQEQREITDSGTKKLIARHFEEFIQDIQTKRDLIQNLREIENDIKEGLRGEIDDRVSMWFRFFRGDTLATDINDIAKALKHSSHPNYDDMIENLEEVVNSPRQLQIYIS